jgi:hypothetical protein
MVTRLLTLLKMIRVYSNNLESEHLGRGSFLVGLSPQFLPRVWYSSCSLILYYS